MRTSRRSAAGASRVRHLSALPIDNPSFAWRDRREWPWLATVALSVLPLAWTCRGAPFGIPIADEYDHLSWLLFRPSLNPFDAMGSPYYWRPVGRQLYYALTGPLFFSAPWLIAVLHGALLAVLGVVVYRVARGALPPAAAAAAATFPILSEPMRALLVSPNGEMLLAIVGAALAVHEAARGRLWTSSAAALAALLSHGAALPVLPAIAWYRERRRSAAARWGLAVAAVGVVWLGGHLLGRTRGTLLMASGTLDPEQMVGIGRALALSATALLNVEDLPARQAQLFLLGSALLVASAVVVLWRDRSRGHPRGVPRTAIGGSMAWFLLGTLPLALVSDWNGWRTSLTGLWLGIAVFGLLWSARPWLVGAFFVLRLVALLSAPSAPPAEGGTLPETTSRFGFVRLVRLQQYVEALHTALRQDPPPSGAIVYLSHAPENFAFATAGDRALRVWFRDPRLEQSYVTRYRLGADQRPRRVVRFDPVRWDFVLLPNPLLDAIVEGEEALARGKAAMARAALGRALRLVQPGVHDIVRVELENSFGVAAYRSGDTAAARRAWQAALALDPAYRGALLNLAAMSANRGEFGEAKRLTLTALATAPQDPLALYYLSRLERSLGNAAAADDAWRRLAATSLAFADSIVRVDGAP